MPQKVLHAGFSQIFIGEDYFQASMLKKCQDFLPAQYVEKVQETHRVTITGECLPQTNVSNRPYALHLELESSHNVTARH